MAGQAEEIIQVLLPDSLSQVESGLLIDIQERPWMQMVPPLLRLENGDEHYDPRVVSLGPYHHGKSQYQLTQKFKLKTLEMFVEGSDKGVQFFYSKVLELVTFCRGCYFHDSTKDYDDRTFAEMMLLDSCFVINFIFCAFGYKKYTATTYDYLGEWYLDNVLHDLFLLENQIPFRLLKLLIRSRGIDEDDLELLYLFLFGGKVETTDYEQWREMADSDDDWPLHVLDGCWLGDTTELHSKKNRRCYELGCLIRIRNIISRCASQYCCIPRFLRRKTDPIVELLFLIISKYVFNFEHSYIPKFMKTGLIVELNLTKRTYTFRSATDLKAKGIYCKPSSFWSRRCINFKPHYFFATLEVPVRTVNLNTKSFLMNMIAYELSPIYDRKIKDRPVSAYVDFMKFLIDNPSDVKELREGKILFSTFGTDEDVVNVFKGIKTYKVGGEFKLHEKVSRAIEAHYNCKTKTWVAELLHTYCRSPWTAIALLAAISLLILTLIQTYYAVLSTTGNGK